MAAPSAELKVVCAWSDDDFIASLEGALAGEAATHFGEILLLESWRSLNRIALDLEGVISIDLLGLAALWRVADAASALGGTLEVQSVSLDLHRRLEAFGLTQRVLSGPPGEVRSLLGVVDGEPGS